MSTDIHYFVFDSLSDWEAAYAIAGINTGQYQRVPDAWRIRTLSPKGEEVTTAGGLRIRPDMSMMADFDPADCRLLILPGGTAWDKGEHGDIAVLAGKVLAAGGAVAAICGATAGLARAGLLDTVRHTSNAKPYLAATNYKGGALYQEAPAVTDGRLITASATAPVDFAYHIFRELYLFTPQVLDAWYGLFRTGKAEYFAALSKAA